MVPHSAAAADVPYVHVHIVEHFQGWRDGKATAVEQESEWKELYVDFFHGARQLRNFDRDIIPSTEPTPVAGGWAAIFTSAVYLL